MMELYNIEAKTAGINDLVGSVETRLGTNSIKPIMIREIFDLLNDQDALLSNIRQLQNVIEKEGAC